MRRAIEGVLKVHAPDWVATDNIEVLVLLELDLGFETSALRKRWYDNSFTKTLRELVAQGLAARYHDATVATLEEGRWSWKQGKEPTRADLARGLTSQRHLSRAGYAGPDGRPQSKVPHRVLGVR